MGELISDSLAADLADMRRRITILEQTSRLLSSSVRDGTFTLQDANGVGIVVLGKLADGHHGIQVLNVNGRTLFKNTSEDGQVVPRPAIAMQADGLVSGLTNGWRPGTSSASMGSLWRGIFTSIGPSIDYNFSVFPNGNSMTYQVVVYETGQTPQIVLGPTTTNVNSGSITGTLTIPAAALVSGTDPAGREMHIEWQAQMNSGTGTVDIFVRTPPVNHV